MPQFRMLLVEELIESDSGEFRIDAATEEDAARVLIDAHDAARARDSSVIRLADGQTVLRVEFAAPSPLGLLGPA